MILNVAYSCDENYMKHVMVSILSLLENNKEFEKIHIYLLCNNVSDESKDALRNLVKEPKCGVFFVENSDIEKRLHTDGKFPISGFGRIFLGNMILEDRIIYMDCDSVLNGSLLSLMQLDLGDSVCGVVQDTVSKYYKTVLGNPPKSRYFNSGFILLDLKKWREQNLQEQALKVIDEFHGSVPHQDQGVLNKICYGKTLWLHPKYNFLCPMFEFTPEQLKMMNQGYYSIREIEEAKENPVFIHFTEGFCNRPWREQCTHPYAYLYRKYQEMTPYAGWIEKHGLNKHTQIVKWVYEHLPFPVYRFFCMCLSVRKRIIERK